MKIAALIVAFFSILFGSAILLGGVVSIVDGDSGYPIFVDIMGMLVLGVVPVVGGIILITLRNANADGICRIKTGLFYLGLFINMIGSVMLLGASIMIGEAPQGQPDYLSIALFFLFGVMPFIGGLILSRHAMADYIKERNAPR
jgi:hypothetical protein